MATKSHLERLAALEAKLESEGKSIRDHIDAKHELILANLQPYRSLQSTVERHTTQITFWRGALAMITFAVTAALGYLGIHRQ